MGQLDPCHSNFLKLDLMLKIMPLSGMIFNMTPNFTELWWHESNFPFSNKSNSLGSSYPYLLEMRLVTLISFSLDVKLNGLSENQLIPLWLITQLVLSQMNLQGYSKRLSHGASVLQTAQQTQTK